MQAWMWRLTEDHAVLYTNDRPTLNAVLAYGKFPHKDLSRATVYSSRNGRACGWQFTFPQTIWNGVVRHLGRSGITMLDHEPGRVAPRQIVASAPADLPVPAPAGTVGLVVRSRAKPGSGAPLPRTPPKTLPDLAPLLLVRPVPTQQGAADATGSPPPPAGGPEKQTAAPAPRPSASASAPLTRAKAAGRARRTPAASEATPAPLAAANSSLESAPPGTSPPMPGAGVRPASQAAPNLVGAAGAATPRSPRTVRRGKK